MLLPVLVSILAMTDTEPPAFFAANEELRAYVLEAGENHPGLLARYHVWRATLQRIPQAGGLDDPMLTYNHFLKSETNDARAALTQRLGQAILVEVGRQGVDVHMVVGRDEALIGVEGHGGSFRI